MLKWWEHCYIGEGVKGSEIIPAVVLVQKAAYDLCPLILAMAKGKDEAIDLAGKIAEACYQETGRFQIKEYIKNR